MAEFDVRTPDGQNLHVHDLGDPAGDLVLCHPGTPSSGRLAGLWSTDAAERGIRLVAYDRPGYGGSGRQPGRRVADAAADSAAVADALGAGRFRTWGTSGGGPHALACAALLPDRVIAAATVASVAPYNAADLDWLAGMGEDNLDEFGAAAAGEGELRAYLTDAAAGLLAVPDGTALVDAMRSLLPEVDAVAFTGPIGDYLHAAMTHGLGDGCDGWLDDDLAFVADWGFDLATITMPVLIAQGRLDLMVPFDHGVWLAAHVRGAQPQLTDTDGHATLLAAVPAVHEWLMQHT